LRVGSTRAKNLFLSKNRARPGLATSFASTEFYGPNGMDGRTDRQTSSFRNSLPL